jgi:hypothetical protein
MKTKNNFTGYTEAPPRIAKEMMRAVKVKDFLPAPEKLKLKAVSEKERSRTNREWQRYRIKDQERGHRKPLAEILKEPTHRLDTSVILPESVYLWMKEKKNKAAFIREAMISRYANDSR